MRSLLFAAPLAAVLGACAAPAPAPVAPAAADTAVPLAIQWVRGSAEHRALFLQVYHAAERAVSQAASGRPAGSWAVILDADETVLDNSPFELRQAIGHLAYTEDRWAGWVRERAAGALPGAAEFIGRVHQLGGRVVIVTNRADSLCADTRTNIAALQIVADAVLCKAPGKGNKDGRFDAVAQGTTGTGLPPLEVLVWVGDNIQDFPGLTQAIGQQPDSAFDQFGRRYFLLPNPMYGSWD